MGSVVYYHRRASVDTVPAVTPNSPSLGRVGLPTARWRDAVRLPAFRVLRNTRVGFLHSPALAVEFQQMAVMHQPVQQRVTTTVSLSRRAQSSSGRLDVTMVVAFW